MKKKKIIVNIASSLLLQCVAIIYGLIIPRLIIETYGSNVNGLIVSITQFLGYIVLLEAGIGPVIKSALYKPIIENNKEKIEQIMRSGQRFFRKIAIIFIIYIGALIILLPNIIGSEYETVFLISLIVVMSISKASEYFFGMLYNLYLQAKQKNYVVDSIRIITYILNLIIIMIIIRLELSILIVQLVLALTFLLKPLIQYIYIKKKYKLSINKNTEPYKLTQKWNALNHHIAFVINWNTDVVILAILTNLQSVSIYSVYTLVLTGIRTIITSVASTIESPLGQLWAKGNVENVAKYFRKFEIVYCTIITLIYGIMYVTIVPFIKVYTDGITDANYIQPLFAMLIVTAYFIHSIRILYSTLIFPVGHFKETSKGAWVEASVNIIISIILVINFGIIGVAIGTCVALGIRAIEFMRYVSKKLLMKSMKDSVKSIIVAIMQISTIIIVCNFLIAFKEISYAGWIIYALKTGIISLVIISLSNLVVYNKQMVEIFGVLKNKITNFKRIGE